MRFEGAYSSKEIPLYIKRLRKSPGLFDSKLSVRKDLHPSIKYPENEDDCNCLSEITKDDIEENDTKYGCSISENDSLIKNKFNGSARSICSSIAETEYSEISKRSVACTIKSSFSVESDNALIDKILVVGHNRENNFHPVGSLMDSLVDSKTKEMLQNLKITDLNRCQKYMIPAMLTKRNVTLVDGPGSGKTVGSLIALVSLLRSSKAQVSVGVGPRSIILCPYSSRCEWIQNQCLKIITGKHSDFNHDGDDIRVNVAYGCGIELERLKLEELIRGYDILICTPRCLLRLLTKEEAFDFRRLSHIIFDEIHILLKSYFKETCEIFKHTKKKINQLQTVIISNYWIPMMKPFTESSLILISCYLDAALFVHLKSVWKFISDESKKIDSVISVIKNEAKEKSIVILCNEDDHLDFIFKEIRKACSRCIYKIDTLDFLNFDIVKSWKKDVSNNYFPILLCTDYILSDIRIYEADCLIHYSLPCLKSDFLYRFCVLLEHFQTVSKENLLNKNIAAISSKRPETFIYSSTKNAKQFPVILEIMEKLHAEVPPGIKDSAEKLLRLKELEKQDLDICTDLKQFGRCLNESQCEMRHEFLPEKDQPDPKIPKIGYVKVHITHVYSPTHFGVRLLEHKTKSENWNRIEPPSHPAVTMLQMRTYFSKPNNVRRYSRPNVGDIVAVESSRGSFKRIKILKLKDYITRTVNDTDIREPRRATVKFVDDGRIADIGVKNLIELPQHLVSIPSPIVDMFVCNLLPVDEDNTWGEIIRKIIENKIVHFRETSENIFCGKVILVLGNSLWLHPFECKRWFPSLKDFVLQFSISKTLLDEKLAVYNEHHLSLLLDKCKLANLSVVIDESEESISQDVLKPIDVSCPVISETSTDEKKSNMENTLIKTKIDNDSSENNDKLKNTLGMCENREDFVFPKPKEPARKELIECKNQSETITFKPSVKWKQDSHCICVTVNLNSDDFLVDYSSSNSLYFKAQMDNRIYEFDEVLFACINVKNSRYYKSGVTIRIKMEKLVKRIRWKRLFKERAQQKWIGPDQDGISDSEEETVIKKLLKKKHPVVDTPNKSIFKNICRHPEGNELWASSSGSEFDESFLACED